jgi:hypothetical protein
MKTIISNILLKKYLIKQLNNLGDSEKLIKIFTILNETNLINPYFNRKNGEFIGWKID